MTKRGLATIRQEQGYALISVLLLVAMLLVIGTLVVQSVTNSQGMVNVSEDIVSAQADGETKLLIKLSDLRAAVMALSDRDKVTLEDVQAAAAPYVEAETVTLDTENQRYVAVVRADGVSDKITQTFRRKVEITLAFTPTDPSPGTGTGEYAVVSFGSTALNGTTINGNVYSAGAVANNQSHINGVLLSPTLPGSSLTPPKRLDITSIVNQLDQDLKTTKSALFATPATQLDFEVRTSTQFTKSTVLNAIKLMPNVALKVDGDLWVKGGVTMEANSSIVASGIIYISGDLLINNGNNMKLQGSLIKVNGTTNFNSEPTVNITGDFYGSSLNTSGTLFAQNIYLTGASNINNLNGSNQFALFAAGSVNVNNGTAPSTLTGHIYTNGALHINGNNKVTINGAASSPATPEKPSEIKFEEKYFVIN